jgi:hypothetical protein
MDARMARSLKPGERPCVSAQHLYLKDDLKHIFSKTAVHYSGVACFTRIIIGYFIVWLVLHLHSTESCRQIYAQRCEPISSACVKHALLDDVCRCGCIAFFWKAWPYVRVGMSFPWRLHVVSCFSAWVV